MDLKGFLKENNGFPENRRVHISPCFRENGEEVLWELRAVSEEEYRNFVKVQIESCEDPLVSKYCMRGILIGKKKNLDITK